MKMCSNKFPISILILFACTLLLSTNASNASAVAPPYLTFGGNYSYDAETRVLSFTFNTADFIEYTNGEYGFDDPILSATLSFGTLMNSTSNNLIFGPDPGGNTGPVDFSIDGFITAKLDNFIVQDSELIWGDLYNIQTVSGAPSSRYIDELFANGGGSGNIHIAFTPMAGGAEDFTITSSGSVGGMMVAAPEPVSAVLFVTGGAALAFRRFLKKRN